MAQYKLHCFCQSGNSYKVALYLNCSGLDWEPVFTDYLNGMTRDPKWREGHLDGRGTGPGGATAGRLTQSGAMLTYLADKTGKFKPRLRERPARGAALDPVRQPQVHELLRDAPLHAFVSASRRPIPAVLAFLKGRFDGALAIVEQHLGRSAFMLGDRAPTIADFSLAGYMFFPPEESGYD